MRRATISEARGHIYSCCERLKENEGSRQFHFSFNFNLRGARYGYRQGAIGQI